jgi:ubiquinone biosynthesis protein
MRKSFEELGPAFIKLGQLFSNRPDILPEAWTEEFKHLQDDVASTPFDSIRKQVEAELGRPMEELFASVEEKPLATASIAQVHGAVLPDGTKVVIKVQKPDIEPVIETDMSLLYFLAGLVERAFPDMRLFDPTGLVDQFAETLRGELDFTTEASNMVKFRTNLKGHPDIVIPTVHWECSSRRVLCLERLHGIKIGDIEALDAAGFDRKRLAALGAEGLIQQVLVDGFFHGDLHPGNVFALEGNRIGLVDFGMVGRLTPQDRETLAAIFVAVMMQDFDALAREVISLCGEEVDLETERRLGKRFREIGEPYLGLPMSEFPIGEILVKLGKAQVEAGLTVPSDLLLLYKVLMEIESSGRRLDPGFNFLDYGQQHTRHLLMQRYSPQRLAREAWKFFLDFQTLARILPQQLGDLLRRLNKGPLALEVASPDLRRMHDALRGSGWIIAWSLVAATLWGSGIALLIVKMGPLYRGVSIPAAANLLMGAGAFTLAVLGALASWRK